MAAGGTSNNTPATVIGIAGASSETGSLGQVGHSKYETKATVPATSSTMTANGKVSTVRVRLRVLLEETACSVMVPLCTNQRPVSHGILLYGLLGAAVTGGVAGADFAGAAIC